MGGIVRACPSEPAERGWRRGVRETVRSRTPERSGEQLSRGSRRARRRLDGIYLPNVNSYKRTEGGEWAGSSSTWGLDNRTVAIRSIPSSGTAARVENRIAGADANPYLVVAANLAAGLDGIEQGLTPPPVVEGNAYALPAGQAPPLPTSLADATDQLHASNFARKLLGDRWRDRLPFGLATHARLEILLADIQRGAPLVEQFHRNPSGHKRTRPKRARRRNHRDLKNLIRVLTATIDNSCRWLPTPC